MMVGRKGARPNPRYWWNAHGVWRSDFDAVRCENERENWSDKCQSFWGHLLYSMTIWKYCQSQFTLQPRSVDA
jgi:hypothetical protein